MYFWNTRGLAQKLRLGLLTQGQRFAYFLLLSILATLIIELCTYIDVHEEPSAPVITESALSLVIGILGTLICYSINKAGDNKEFIDRFICMSVPVGFRYLVITVAAFAVYFKIAYTAGADELFEFLESTTWTSVGIFVCLQVGFYSSMMRHIGWISRRADQPAVQ